MVFVVLMLFVGAFAPCCFGLVFLLRIFFFGVFAVLGVLCAGDFLAPVFLCDVFVGLYDLAWRFVFYCQFCVGCFCDAGDFVLVFVFGFLFVWRFVVLVF